MPNSSDYEKECYIETHYWPAKRGVPKPTLVISVDALLTILFKENACIAEEDVPGLTEVFSRYARESGSSDSETLNQWTAYVEEALEEIGTDADESDEDPGN